MKRKISYGSLSSLAYQKAETYITAGAHGWQWQAQQPRDPQRYARSTCQSVHGPGRSGSSPAFVSRPAGPPQQEPATASKRNVRSIKMLLVAKHLSAKNTSSKFRF
jgi:hypothetical protein